MSKPPVKIFSRASPCNYKDIWNTFRTVNGFIAVQVDIAHAKIGLNVPRGMQHTNRLTVRTVKNSEMYFLTPLGEEWVEHGVRNYMRNHPDIAHTVRFPPAPLSQKRAGKRVSRSREVKETV
jgi:hypothetical protein